MSNKLSMIVMFILAILMFFACAPRATQVSSPAQNQDLSLENSPEMLQETQLKWLNESLCQSPCWEGITPGITNKTDALSLLMQVENVNDVKVSPYESVGEINWYWGDNPLNSGRLFYSINNDVVYSVWPGIGNGLTLADIAQQFGPPTHAWVREVKPVEAQQNQEEKNYSLEIVWLNKGFSVSGANPNHHGWIDAGFLIGSVKFFTPTHEGYILAVGNVGKNLVPWHGYDTWENYIASE
ncbi:MAG TPA: hypothetical protein PL173_13765 [Saprospiraceae bacterium]|nr:hypothetical protein [Saprospiraceae bacterium]